MVSNVTARRRGASLLPSIGSLAEHYERGVDLRRKTPREKHADLLGSVKRDPVAILAAGDRTRVPELVPVRYERMLASPFAFLRGAAAVMAEDLRHQPIAGIGVQACGDCHLMNFGAFATPEENILFDINDFDETLPGVDFTVDLKRLAASVAVAALAANFSNKRARATAAATIEAYRTRMRTLAKLSPLEIWHSRIELVPEIKYIEDRALRRKLHAILTKAGKKLEQDDNFPHLVKGRQARIADKPPLIFPFHAKARRAASRQRRAHVCLLPKTSSAGASVPVRPVFAQRRGFQSGRGRKRGNVLCNRTVHKRRRRSSLSSGQRGRKIRAGTPRAQI
jgi:hypothetical protein